MAVGEQRIPVSHAAIRYEVSHVPVKYIAKDSLLGDEEDGSQRRPTRSVVEPICTSGG